MDAMSETNPTKPTPILRIAIDLVLCAGFFALMFSVIRSHVPSNDPAMITFWSGAAASCMTVVFWLCIQMFRVVLKAQREAAR